MSTDPTATTTEIPVTAAIPAVEAEPARAAGQEAGSTVPIPVVPADPFAAPGFAATGSDANAPTAQPGATLGSHASAQTQASSASASASASGVEPCPHCGTPLALDQRYCLECGAPRTYLSGMLLDRLRSPAAAQASPGQPISATAPGGAVTAFGMAPTPAQGSSTWQRGSVLTLIASVGVLLLAMGVGVLIGRSGGSSSSGNAAPQIVSVPAAAAGAASTTTTPTTPAASSAAKAGAAAAGGGAKHKANEAGVGATPSKPAPPTVLKNLRTGSGQSYEQKSKNLPNVVSTG